MNDPVAGEVEQLARRWITSAEQADAPRRSGRMTVEINDILTNLDPANSSGSASPSS